MGKKYQFKLTMLGDGGVGKTSLKNRYLTGEFTDKYLTTLGVDFASHSITVDEKDVYIQIWDVAGQEIFSSIRKSYFQGAKGALIVFDLTRPETFEGLFDGWIKPFIDALKETPDLPVAILGNKADLGNERVINQESGQRLVDKVKNDLNLVNVLYFETSAKEGHNVIAAFESIARQVLINAE